MFLLVYLLTLKTILQAIGFLLAGKVEIDNTEKTGSQNAPLNVGEGQASFLVWDSYHTGDYFSLHNVAALYTYRGANCPPS